MAARKSRKIANVTTSGKRKTSIARAVVSKGKGRVRVNGQPIYIMEPTLARRKALEPIQIAEAMNRLSGVDIKVDVHGGGQMGQVDAIRTAIARGLVKWNDGAEGDDEGRKRGRFAQRPRGRPCSAVVPRSILGRGHPLPPARWR